MNTKESEIVKCPYCGNGKVKVEKKRGETYEDFSYKMNVTARCTMCFARGPVVSERVNFSNEKTKLNELQEQAVVMWNRRCENA